MSAHLTPASWSRRLLVALGVVALLALATLLFTWNRAKPEPARAAGPGPGMSLAAPATVFEGVPFTLTINTALAPDVEISGFTSEVLFPEELKYTRRPSCSNELQAVRADGGTIALCDSFTPILTGGAAHLVLSEFALPLAALNVTPGSTTLLLELDFICNAPGSHKLTLTAFPDSQEGAVYANLSGQEILVKTVPQDYDADGDTTPETHQVADTLTIECSEEPPPTATPPPTAEPTAVATAVPTTPPATPSPGDTDGDGCTNEQELGPNPLLGGQRDPLDFWDFFDPNGDGSVSLQDFLQVLARFGATGNHHIDPLSDPPPPPAYHTRFDRTGAPPGENPWESGPPDGVISLRDFLALLAQFGHTCAYL